MEPYPVRAARAIYGKCAVEVVNNTWNSNFPEIVGDAALALVVKVIGNACQYAGRLASEPLQLSLGATFAALAREYSAGDQMGLDVEHIVDGGKEAAREGAA